MRTSRREQAEAAWAVRILLSTLAKRSAQAQELASSSCQAYVSSALSYAVGLPLAQRSNGLWYLFGAEFRRLAAAGAAFQWVMVAFRRWVSPWGVSLSRMRMAVAFAFVVGFRHWGCPC